MRPDYGPCAHQQPIRGLLSHFRPQLLNLANQDLWLDAETRCQQKNCRDAWLSLIAFKKRYGGRVKPGKFSQFLMRQSLFLSDAKQNEGEGFGEFQAAILVVSRRD